MKYRFNGKEKRMAFGILEAFTKDVFPFIGQKPIADIKPLELLNGYPRREQLYAAVPLFF